MCFYSIFRHFFFYLVNFIFINILKNVIDVSTPVDYMHSNEELVFTLVTVMHRNYRNIEILATARKWLLNSSPLK